MQLSRIALQETKLPMSHRHHQAKYPNIVRKNPPNFTPLKSPPRRKSLRTKSQGALMGKV
jgi:hypothetical protein